MVVVTFEGEEEVALEATFVEVVVVEGVKEVEAGSIGLWTPGVRV